LIYITFYCTLYCTPINTMNVWSELFLTSYDADCSWKCFLLMEIHVQHHMVWSVQNLAILLQLSAVLPKIAILIAHLKFLGPSNWFCTWNIQISVANWADNFQGPGQLVVVLGYWACLVSSLSNLMDKTLHGVGCFKCLKSFIKNG